MASRVADIGIWRVAGRRAARVESRQDGVSGVNLDKAARMAPEWGRVEARYTDSRDSGLQMPIPRVLGL